MKRGKKEIKLDAVGNSGVAQQKRGEGGESIT